MKRQKLTVEVATKEIIRQRASEEGLSIGAYLDNLVRRDDLRRRIALDRSTLAAAELNSPAANTPAANSPAANSPAANSPAANSRDRAARNAAIAAAAARSRRR
jgi:hypothetical protein